MHNYKEHTKNMFLHVIKKRSINLKLGSRTLKLVYKLHVSQHPAISPDGCCSFLLINLLKESEVGS